MGSKRIDETGHEYGKLTVTGYHHTGTTTSSGKKRTIAYWSCRCGCGRASVVSGADLRRKDGIRCCRVCQRMKHGHTRCGWQSPTYVCWHAMMTRCTNKKYRRYGGRGIGVCKRWHSFKDFLADMGERPSKQHSIERENNNGNYTPGNCYWATKREQDRNKNNNIWVTINGERKIVMDWIKHFGTNIGTYNTRLRHGWSRADALSTPAFPSGHNRTPSHKHITIGKVTHTLSEWLRLYGMNRWTYYDRRQRGLSEEESLTNPVARHPRL